MHPTPWWTTDEVLTLKRGRLIWVFVPHVSQEPTQLFIQGRAADATDHTKAQFELGPLRINHNPVATPGLPVAAVPSYSGEVLAVYRAKKRPAVVLSTGGTEVPSTLRAGSARWQSAPSLLVIPSYGTEQDGTRGGWPADFVRRIQLCEFPQYVLDWLPISRSGAPSVLRLDHIQPVGLHYISYELTPWVLSDPALEVLDDWLQWLQTGFLPADGVLHMAKEYFSDFR
jgi:hypothetical protein